ncbi:MAG TPA: protein adenylyltransferase SelO family protein, partial [Chitinophagaceae bacterium]|nr:protein adenylyltransferase SelO family protein [Chitinophagaceae bacterium]
SVAKWNLGCLGGAIAPLLKGQEELVKMLETYDDVFWSEHYRMMGNKIGLDAIRQDDIKLFNDLEKTLRIIQPDMTIFYQLLIDLPSDVNSKEDVVDHFNEAFYEQVSAEEARPLFDWIKTYTERICTNKITREESKLLMRKTSPRFILRNYLLHQSIEDLEKGDDGLFVKLQEAMKEPYSGNHDEFFKKRPEWATEKAGCSQLSCSS